MKFSNWGFLSAVFLLSTPALGSEQGLYYRIHQATRLLEQFVQGKCQNEDNKIKDQLIKADSELGENILKNSKSRTKSVSAFEADLQTIWKLYNHRTSLKVGAVESFRFDIHQKAQLANLKHEESWYKEANLCDAPIR